MACRQAPVVNKFGMQHISKLLFRKKIGLTAFKHCMHLKLLPLMTAQTTSCLQLL